MNEPEIRKIVDYVLEVDGGRIGTHSTSCYTHHAACLASLIKYRLDEEVSE
jgi:hypothetical protein